jgi:hypothetical protein
MDIVPPFGYAEIVPLERHHRVLLPDAAAGAAPAFARDLNAMAISFSEFAAAQRDYPIVFSAAPGGEFAPLAVLGLSDADNLFIDAEGRWERGAYVPAFVRRYPFCVARYSGDAARADERLVCVEKSWIDANGIALFDSAGAPTPAWTDRERLLAEFEKDLELTAQMCAFLARLDLLVPFTFEVRNGDAPGLVMNGMHRIDEERLSKLTAANHKALATRGIAARIYAHLFSLGNFARLTERAIAAQSRAAAR